MFAHAAILTLALGQCSGGACSLPGRIGARIFNFGHRQTWVAGAPGAYSWGFAPGEKFGPPAVTYSYAPIAVSYAVPAVYEWRVCTADPRYEVYGRMVDGVFRYDARRLRTTAAPARPPAPTRYPTRARAKFVAPPPEGNMPFAPDAYVTPEQVKAFPAPPTPRNATAADLPPTPDVPPVPVPSP